VVITGRLKYGRALEGSYIPVHVALTLFIQAFMSDGRLELVASINIGAKLSHIKPGLRHTSRCHHNSCLLNDTKRCDFDPIITILSIVFIENSSGLCYPLLDHWQRQIK
jgi:hypothetical protein